VRLAGVVLETMTSGLIVIALLGGLAGVIAAIRPARRAARLPVLAASAAG
jgi:putative ABC transport system permease protein